MSGAIMGGPDATALGRCRGWRRVVLLSCLAWLMTGCSAVRLGYNHAPDLAYWWFDGHVDFRDDQSARAHEVIDDWFKWHRRVELPVYAELLSKARGQVAGPATAAQACQWFNDVRLRVDASLERALPGVAEVALSLSPQQIAHLEHKYAERNEEFAQSISAESAKPIATARVEAARGVDTLRFSAAAARTLVGEVVALDASSAGAGRTGFTLKMPIGVIAAVSPFNFPLNLVLHKIAPAVAAGCPVVLKPASSTAMRFEWVRKPSTVANLN